MVNKMCKICGEKKRGNYCYRCRKNTKNRYVSTEEDKKNAGNLVEQFRAYLKELIER